MKIISCPECKEKISDTAAFCPCCGFPILPEGNHQIRNEPLKAEINHHDDAIFDGIKFLFGAGMGFGGASIFANLAYKFSLLDHTLLCCLCAILSIVFGFCALGSLYIVWSAICKVVK